VTNTASGARKAVSRVYQATRNLPDRVLHRRRHSLALSRLSARPRPRRILVICHGNICRSPYLQAVLQRHLPDVRVMSGGFVGKGRPVPPFSLSLSAKKGLDLSRFRSQSITMEQMKTADLIVVMDASQARHVAKAFGVAAPLIVVAGDLDPAVAGRTIRDPWNQPIDVFEASFDRLDRCAAALLAALPRAD
jgi:protein-tyrosine-phosphatase